MIDTLRRHLEENLDFLKGKRLLIAVSGGVDSMVLAALFRELGYDFAVAHCNFRLRGPESDDDEKFVEEYFESKAVHYFTTRFDTHSYASGHKVSVQVAARRLRYAWFDELARENHFDYVLTAHHLNDSLETFLINLSRGTGLDGLVGIPPQRDIFVRPLLPFSREEILRFANQNQVPWREDSSNASDKYLRNKIRQKLIPALTGLNPSFLNSFSVTVHHLAMSQSLVDDAIALVSREIVVSTDTRTIIDIDRLLKLSNYKAYLYHFLKDLGFTAWDDIYQLPFAQTGKKVFSDNFMILKDRLTLIVSAIPEDDRREYLVDRFGANESPVEILITPVDAVANASNDCIFVDADKLSFPLILRKWRPEDEFQPFGMKGSKLVSKFFKDEKMSYFDKQASSILLSGSDIVWIVNRRADDRFRVTPQTKRILKIRTSS